MPEAFSEGSEDFTRMRSLFMDAARELSPVRPDMDPVTAEAMGVAWSQRWARIIPNLRGDSHGHVDASRMHESVWELFQSWPAPASYDSLLGRLTDEDGEPIAPVKTGKGADIPRLSEAMMTEDELERAAQQDAAIELAKTNIRPKSDGELAVTLFASMGRPAKPSEVFPLMVKAGYEKKERTFRDLCSMLGLKDQLVKGDDGTYAVPEGGESTNGVEGADRAGLDADADDGDGDRDE
jgi:S-DNA-T family DNA segregation ATPase FtsK/SpoIIIE